MATFYDLSETAQILFMAAQFIATCMGICMVPMVYQKRRWLPKLILPIGFLISGGMLAIFSANIRVQKQNLPMSAVTKWASELPIWISILLLVAIFGYMVFLLVRERLYRKSTITRFSIKEGLDSLSSGLCFYEPSGRIILSNNCMQELCHKLVGRDLQNAALFWQLLQQGETNHVSKKPGVSLNGVCLRQGDTPAYRLPDGTVWSFAMEQLGSICQLTAADTTQIHDLTTRLEQENQQLEQFNQRLRDYGEKADALTRAKERLEIKVKVHGMLGQALLATRRCLQDEGISTDEAMSLWHHSVAVLHKEAVQETEKPLEALKKAAAATGITLELKGEIPEEAKVRQLFLQAAAESLTNAISHAKAKTLYVDFAEDPYAYRVSIYNDGLLPTGPVREGGGLSALRKNVERIGGQLEIKSVPQFILTVTIGKGGDRDV
jgi:signal transduction histidine kinase